MRVRVVQLWAGATKRAERDAAADHGCIGDLVQDDVRRNERSATCVRLLVPDQPSRIDALPPLWKPMPPIGLGPGGIVLAGLQSIHGEVHYQEWNCELVSRDPRRLPLHLPQCRYGGTTLGQILRDLQARGRLNAAQAIPIEDLRAEEARLAADLAAWVPPDDLPAIIRGPD